jgi:hypothetical protein
MVSKYLLAAQEAFFRAVDAGAPTTLLKELAACYYDIRAGIGDKKEPEVYGAFPMDPYSHTPAHTGARQPGLTGQVKEDILCRRGELGLWVVDGRLLFRPLLLGRDELRTAAGEFRFYDVRGEQCTLPLEAGSLAFTYCQVPIIYRLASRRAMRVIFTSPRRSINSEQLHLDRETSRAIFDRSGVVRRIEVDLSPAELKDF